MGEKVTELELEGARVVKDGSCLWAFKMEPKDGVHDALVVGYSVFESLLHQTVDIIFFQNGAFIGPLNRWLVEKVHIYLINYYNKCTN